MGQIILYKTLILLLKIISAKGCYFLAKIILNIYFIFNKKDRQIVAKNLTKIHPDLTELAKKKLTKQIFYNFSNYLIDFFNSGRITSDNLTDFFQITGEKYLTETKKNGQGGILVSAHIGNWELGGIYLALKKHKINIVVLEHKNKKVNNLFCRFRKNKGVQICLQGQAARGCLRALKQNELIAIAADKMFDTVQPISVNFMNEKVNVPRGPARLSLKTGAPILPIFIIMQGNGRYKIEINPPLYPQKTEQKTAEAYIKIIENYIKKYPEQWFAFQDIWGG
jgi:lauroyl/myristoyl acyltransferase